MIRLIRSLKDNSETKTPLHPGEAKLEHFDLSGKALYKNQIIIINQLMRRKISIQVDRNSS